MREEQIKILEQMRDDYLKSQEDAISEAFERVSSETRDKLLAWSDDQKPKIAALTDAISFIRDTSEMLEAAKEIRFWFPNPEKEGYGTSANIFVGLRDVHYHVIGELPSTTDSIIAAWLKVKEQASTSEILTLIEK
jgi:hypothetical protein